MKNRKELEQQIRRCQEEIGRQKEKIEEAQKLLKEYTPPERIRDASIGEALADGTILIDTIWGEDESWAIIAAPPCTITLTNWQNKDTKKRATFLIDCDSWFLATPEIIEQLEYYTFDIPEGHYWTGTTFDNSFFVMKDDITKSAIAPKEMYAWYFKLVKFSRHSCHDDDYSY
jgi:hypothetical protein